MSYEVLSKPNKPPKPHRCKLPRYFLLSRFGEWAEIRCKDCGKVWVLRMEYRGWVGGNPYREPVWRVHPSWNLSAAIAEARKR